MFITAKEALDLYETSDVAAKPILDKLDADIRQAAAAGKRELICTGKKLTEIAVTNTPVEPNALQAKVIAELKRAKFRVKWGQIGEPFVPKALQTDNGDGPLHANWGISMEW